MTPTFRLYFSALLAILALAAGLLGNRSGIDAPAVAASRNWEPASVPSAAEVDQLVSRIVAAGLFPNAGLQVTGAEGNSAISGMTVADLEVVFENPALAAFVRSDDIWSIHILRGEGDALTLHEGDFLADVWRISEITATTVTFERDGEIRHIDVFSVTDG